MALDERLADVQMALGHVHYAADLDLPAAGRAFRQALELDPGTRAHHMLAIWHKGQRHFADAPRNAERALAADPPLPTAHGTLGWTMLNVVIARVLQWRFDDARREAERAVALGGVRERALQAYALAAGRHAEARTALAALRGPDGEMPRSPTQI